MTPLELLAARAAADPLFLAHPLAEYARTENLDDAGLAAALGLPADRLTDVRLCGAPRTDPDGFRDDVQSVADAFGIDPGPLAEVVHAARGLAELRAANAVRGELGYLLAARDDDRPEEPS